MADVILLDMDHQLYEDLVQCVTTGWSSLRLVEHQHNVYFMYYFPCTDVSREILNVRYYLATGNYLRPVSNYLTF